MLAFLDMISFGPRKAFVQVEDDFLHKVLYFTVFWVTHKHHPIMGEALHGGLLPHLCMVPHLQLHLQGMLASPALGLIGLLPCCVVPFPTHPQL